MAELTADLIRIPTLNPPGENYRAICEAIATRLRPRFTCQLLRAEGAPGDSASHPRWNFVARVEQGAGPTIHFNAHHDVVEVGQGWSVDPFGGEIRDGRVYGRGACDMKGGLAAAIVAAETFLDLCPDWQGAIEVSATADEETGGYGGVAWLAERGYFAHVDHVIIPEPLNPDRICLGHRGVWWAEVETHGHIGHGSMPFLGDCAVRHMGAVIAEMEASLFPALGARKTAMPVVPPQAQSSTLNINSLHGGQAELPPEFTGFPAPVVPDSARMVIDRRFLIEEDIADVKAEFRTLLDRVAASREDFRYTLRDLHEVIPTMTARDAPVVQTVSAAVEEVLGHAPDYVVSPGTYDQKHIDRIGRLKNCIAYGPGILDLAHQPDEWIGIDDMVTSAEVMVVSLVQLLCP
ncbi:MAG: acetylornithine deacetylase/succinyl-diaminopimelate desuccinylase family protein [Pseudomonadota bacterium]